MRDWRSTRTLEHRGRSLGFAVRLVDVFTGSEPSGTVTVSLVDGDVEPVRNPDGYYVFFDLPLETVTLVVDGGERYFDERRRIELSSEADEAVDPSTVVVEDRTEPVVVELTPTAAYEFPASATTVRGHVEDADGDPVEGATVTFREFDVATRTSEAGEYALFVPVTSECVIRVDGRKWVRVDGDGDAAGRGVANGGTGHDPTLVVTHPSYAEVAQRIEVAAGARTVHYITLE